MSQLDVNVIAPLGYTGPNLTGDNDFVRIVDASGNTIFKEDTSNNICIGENALSNDILASDNIAIGYECMRDSVNGSSGNIAIGFQALLGNQLSPSTSSGNIAIGFQTLQDSINAQANVAIGVNSGIGVQNGYFNTFLGDRSGPRIKDGHNNTFLGFLAGQFFIDSSESNTVIGSSDNMLSPYNGSGQNNLFAGSNAEWNYGGGDNNVILGAYPVSFAGAITGNNNIQIGYNSTKASLAASNSITLGNSSHTVIRAAVTSITSLSDARDKKDVKELGAGLEFVKGLKPVEFVWDEREEKGKHDIKDFGFIAQDLKKSQEDAELAETLKLVYEENPEKLEASYGKLIPILVKAIQDLSAKVEALEAK